MIRILLLLMLGCSHKIVTTSSGLTHSPCFDGVMVNIQNSCISIHSHPVPGTEVIRVNCIDGDTSSQWASKTFYFVGNDKFFSKSGWSHLCSDPIIDVYFVDSPIKLPVSHKEKQ